MTDPAARDAAAVAAGKRVLFFALLSSGLGQSFLFAVLPPLGREMGFTEIEIGTIVTISAVIFVLASPIWGGLSERWGRRPVVLIGLLFSSTMTALFAAAIELHLAAIFTAGTTFILLILLRALFSASASGIYPSVQAYIADVTPHEKRAAGFALVGAAFGLGMVGGPGLAWAMSEISLVAPFFGIAALAGLAGIAALIWLREPARHATRHHTGGQIPFVRLVPYFAIATLTMTILSLIQQVTGFRFQDLFQLSAQETAQHSGAALMALAGASILAQLVLARRSGWPALSLVRSGAVLAIAAMALLLSFESYTVLVAAMALLGAGLGLIFPGFMAALSFVAGEEAQGRVAGFNASAQGLGFVIGPIVGSALYGIDPLAPYLFALVLLTLIALLAFTRQLPEGRTPRLATGT